MNSKGLKFTKMHGIGNDYIYLDCLNGLPDDVAGLSIEVSDRHTGIGSDGLILICPGGEKADFKMRIFNADGSEAKMCGNGIRCVGKYVYDNGLTERTTLRVDTLSGVKILELHPGKDGNIATVTVDMGEPSTECSAVGVHYPTNPIINGAVETSRGEVRLTAVSMGNPHGVVFTDSITTDIVHSLGRELEMHPMWTDRANIEFARIAGDGTIEMRVWERGSGETMACGTGACAVAVAGVLTGLSPRTVDVKLPGGILNIEWRDDNHVYMTGPAETIATGVYFRKH